MIPVRRLKRNFRRFIIPLENVLLWVAGPMALGCYWLWHGALHCVRRASSLAVLWR